VRVFLFLAFFLASCAKTGATAEAAQSACRVEMFEENRFTVCDPGRGSLDLIAAGRDEPAIRRLADLEASLGSKAGTVAFAMNAGMYDDEGRPVGLAIVESRQKHAINLRKGGGNFHVMPNGVF